MANVFMTDFRHTEELYLISYFFFMRGRLWFHWWILATAIGRGHQLCLTNIFYFLFSYLGFFLSAGVGFE